MLGLVQQNQPRPGRCGGTMAGLKLFLCKINKCPYCVYVNTSQSKASTKYVYMGVTRGGKGGTIARAPSHYGGAKSQRGRRMAAGGAKKPQQCHKYFLQCSTCASERTVSNMGAPNLLLAQGAI